MKKGACPPPDFLAAQDCWSEFLPDLHCPISWCAIRYFVTATQRGQVKTLDTRSLVSNVVNQQRGYQRLIATGPTNQSVDHCIAVELICVEVAQVIVELIRVTQITLYRYRRTSSKRDCIPSHCKGLYLWGIRRRNVSRGQGGSISKRQVVYGRVHIRSGKDEVQTVSWARLQLNLSTICLSIEID